MWQQVTRRIFKGRHGTLEKAFGTGGSFFQIDLAGSKVRIGPVSAHRGVRKSQHVAVHQASNRVRVHRGGADLIELLRLVARGFQVGQQIAQSRVKQRGRTGVTQHQLRAGIVEVTIHEWFSSVRRQTPCPALFDPDRRGLVESFFIGKLTVQSDRAVTSKSTGII